MASRGGNTGMPLGMDGMHVAVQWVGGKCRSGAEDTGECLWNVQGRVCGMQEGCMAGVRGVQLGMYWMGKEHV